MQAIAYFFEGKLLIVVISFIICLRYSPKILKDIIINGSLRLNLIQHGKTYQGNIFIGLTA